MSAKNILVRLTQLAGEDVAAQIVAEYGGKTVYIRAAICPIDLPNNPPGSLSLIRRIEQIEEQLAVLLAAQKLHSQVLKGKAAITKDHAARAKTLYADGIPITEIGKQLGISRTAASLLIHDKYPFAVDQLN